MINTQTKKFRYIVAGLLLAIAIAVGSIALISNLNTDIPESSQNVQENKELVSYTAAAGETVLDQLKTITDDVEVLDSTYGEYVNSINGLKSGDQDKYWLFYVNGEMANKGAAEYVTEGGELIEWKFE